MKKIILNNYKGPSTKLRVNIKGIRAIKTKVSRMLREEGEQGTVSITFCDDGFIRKLNKRYRKKDCATDVLSFKMGEDGLLGDIIISVETAGRQAKEFGCTLTEELTRLAEHGLLHLLGYSHKEMEERGSL
ncbi:MAG: rRNA maturation RNase YbeY [Candidatus Margulisiibacteriota bacterium]